MSILIRLALWLIIVSITSTGYSQIITNPSFEGDPQQDSPPYPWSWCGSYSTPDTQPGIWNVTKAASHGNTYLGLVTRGNLGPFANKNEAALIVLNSFLKSGKTYNLSIDLSFSKTLGHNTDENGFVSYAKPAVLKIWGGRAFCEKSELLWQSPVIDHTNWKRYNLAFTPQTGDIFYLIFEADYSALPTYFGNILIDNIIEKEPGDSTEIIDPIELEPIDSTEIIDPIEPEPIDSIEIIDPTLPTIPTEPINPGCSLEAYNVFTPNGDGKNDVFILKPLSNVARYSLKICNRWGKVIFETNDIGQGWDGKINGADCAVGVYYWFTEYMCINDNQILDNKMRGTVTLLK